MGSFVLSATAFGVMSSMYFYAYMLMQIPVGLLADSLGARMTVTAGMFLGGIGSLLFGLAQSPEMLFIGRFLVGIGMATAFVSLLKIQSQWFTGALFGTLSGFGIFFGNLGGAVGQTPLAFLTSYSSWRISFVSIAGITFMAAAGCILFVRNKPEDIGLPPVAADDGVAQLGLAEGLVKVLRQKKMWGASIFYAFNQASLLAFMGSWLVPWMREVHGMSITAAANLGMLCAGGTMLGSVLAGSISDKIKLRKPVIVLGSVLATAMWAVITFYRGDSVLVIAVLLFALGLGSGVFPVSMAVAKEVNSIRVTGTAIAVLNTIGFFVVAVVTSLLGVIADFGDVSHEARFRQILIACLAVSILSTVAGMLSYETHAENTNADS